VRSIEEECLDRVLPLGEWHLRRPIREFVALYHVERNHQGIGNVSINRPPAQQQRAPFGAVSESAGFSVTTSRSRVAQARRRSVTVRGHVAPEMMKTYSHIRR
jgi:hypothetical protein